MKTKISDGNPLGVNAKGYLWEYFAKNGPSPLHLDYGAHDGHMLAALAKSKLIDHGIGVDLNSTVVEKSQGLLPPNVTLTTITKNPRLPFDEGHFDSVSIVGVLEHIAEQDHIIDELKRVTKPGGVILFAVPGKHLFSFLDMGNWKFVFPRAHKFFYCLTHSEDQYNARYTANKDGLIGDIEAEKSWHEHFSRAQLASLLEKHGLKVKETDGFGYFSRVLKNLRFFMPGATKKILDPLIAWDARTFASTEIWTIVVKS
jgi:SAM-dependent methyltransferase